MVRKLLSVDGNVCASNLFTSLLFMIYNAYCIENNTQARKQNVQNMCCSVEWASILR